jgi:hypothetical protein
MAREIIIKGHSFKSILLDGQRYVLEREVAPYIKEAGRTFRAKRPVQQHKDKTVRKCGKGLCGNYTTSCFYTHCNGVKLSGWIERTASPVA